MARRIKVLEKTLSRNDVGDTGTHQAGILVPKGGGIVSFFPSLPSDMRNPRRTLRFVDNAGKRWDFEFIYYNNQRFGGTRNEYRLTGMTAFIRGNNLKAGDRVIVRPKASGLYSLDFARLGRPALGGAILVLSGTWKVIELGSS